MNLDDLRSVQSKERQKDSLQHLRDTFYEDVGSYVEELKAERDRAAERADDPFSSPEVGRLTDEIETAEEVVEAIYERRMGKLVKRASLAAAGVPADDEGLTAEEQALFEDLVERIETNKSLVLDVLSGEAESLAGGGDGQRSDSAAEADETVSGADETSPEQTPAEDAGPSTDRPAGEASSVSAADLMGSGPDGDGENPGESSTEDSDDESPENRGESAAASPSGNGTSEFGGEATDGDRTTVRITRDVGEILGVDEREYELAADDVVTLPETNAEPLIERDAAERLD